MGKCCWLPGLIEIPKERGLRGRERRKATGRGKAWFKSCRCCGIDWLVDLMLERQEFESVCGCLSSQNRIRFFHLGWKNLQGSSSSKPGRDETQATTSSEHRQSCQLLDQELDWAAQDPILVLNITRDGASSFSGEPVPMPYHSQWKISHWNLTELKQERCCRVSGTGAVPPSESLCLRMAWAI